MIACAWLDPYYYNTFEGNDGSSMSVSTMTADSIRKRRVCDSSLHPVSRALKCRLNKACSHWSSPAASSNTYYQMNFWATGTRKYRNVQLCKECNVRLCTNSCYKTFHIVWNLVAEKASIAREYDQGKGCPRAARPS